MLQQAAPDDYVIGTGETHTVREFVELAFAPRRPRLAEVRRRRPGSSGRPRWICYRRPAPRPRGARLDAHGGLSGARQDDGRRRRDPRRARGGAGRVTRGPRAVPPRVPYHGGQTRRRAMKRLSICLAILVGVVFLRAVPAAAQLGITVPNWPVPSASSGSRGAMTTQGYVTPPGLFSAVTPCRVVDTRLAPGPFGGPFLAVGAPRSFAIPSGPCAGIPPNSSAYSLNVTVTNTQGKGFILVYPQGGAQPLLRHSTTLLSARRWRQCGGHPDGDWAAGITVAAGVHGTNLIIDINGYYAGSVAGNRFVLDNNDNSWLMRISNGSTSCGAGPVRSDGPRLIRHRDRWIQQRPRNSRRRPWADGWSLPGGTAASGPAGKKGGSLLRSRWSPGRGRRRFRGPGDFQGPRGRRISLEFLRGRDRLGGALGYPGYGVYAGGNMGASGVKFFVEPHPTMRRR